MVETKTAPEKLVYRFSEGNAEMGTILGNKGAQLSEMSRLGVPVPPGLIISTDACRLFYANDKRLPDDLWESVVSHVHELEQVTGKTFGSPDNPLTVSVRSGAAVSMPGMMETILNLGLKDETAVGLGQQMGDLRPALDAYRRFVQGYGHIVLGVDSALFEKILAGHREEAGVHFDYELDQSRLRRIIIDFKATIQRQKETELPQDPWLQLRLGISAVLNSWNIPRAVHYREYHGISHDLGTAVVVMAMVFGNLGQDSGTGVLFSRNPSTGARELYGEYLPNAQGEDVVAGIRTPHSLSWLAEAMPSVYREVAEAAERLEGHYRDMQDIEFTVERGRVYILQTRHAKRTPVAATRVAVEMAQEGLLSREEALLRVAPEEVSQVLLPRFDPAAREAAENAGMVMATGLGASPGAATGKAIFDPDRAAEAAHQGEAAVLVRPETSPDDIHGILPAVGLLTLRGGITSHAAVVTRGLGKPCVVGCEELDYDEVHRTISARGKVIRENDPISIDGATGEVFAGPVATVLSTIEEQKELNILLDWADDARRLGIRGNADTPEDTARAIALGAEGIGLCRTEHMFFQEERVPHIQKVLINAPEAHRLEEEAARTAPGTQDAAKAQQMLETSPVIRRYYAALAELEKYQTADFLGILRVAQGKPITIRLLDAPLHEFLPNREELLAQVAQLRQNGPREELAEKEQLLHMVESVTEANPMLGHRGCRLGLTFPSIYDMQMRAILNAAAQLVKEGREVHPEIMIPLAGHVNELQRLRRRLEAVAQAVEAEQGVHVPYRYGTMIEVPRAVETAEELATEAEFFSFGSNDLTQMVFAFSRDDAERKFLRFYQEQGILPANPFATLDSAVGRMMKRATEEGRQARPDLIVGICGEHGGDPQSIHLCHQMGLDYVSASSFRVPVARLTAAQAAIKDEKR